MEKPSTSQVQTNDNESKTKFVTYYAQEEAWEKNFQSDDFQGLWDNGELPFLQKSSEYNFRTSNGK